MDKKIDITMSVYVNDIPYLIKQNTKCCHEYEPENIEPSRYNYCPVGTFSCPFQENYYSEEFCKHVTENHWKNFFDKFTKNNLDRI